jgi:hypothetical protein
VKPFISRSAGRICSRVFALLFSTALCGCAATPEEYAMQVTGLYGSYCEKLGYQPNTDAWRLCIQLEDAKTVDRVSRHRY